MSCSPLLAGIDEPEAVLAVLGDHPVLGYSEPPQTWEPLARRGWAEYERGRWRITDEGRKVLGPRTRAGPSPRAGAQLSLMDFFGR